MMLSNSGLPLITLTSPGAVAFHIFNWPIRWYGVFVALGFLIGYLFAERLINKYSDRITLSLRHFHDLVFWILIFSIVFARLYFVILSWNYFKDHLNEIPRIWYGGQSVHGGILGAVIAALLYTGIKKISFYKYMDIIALVFPLGQAIGRWGNFFNNEAFGKPIQNGLMRLYIPQEFRPEQYIDDKYFHPTFLYESFLDFVIFVFLYKKYNLWKEKPGKIFWVYLSSYSLIRFFLEFLRVDSIYLFGSISSAHIASTIIILVSSIALIKMRR